ncbi:MAG: DUF2656 domain-containing protein [Cyanobacteria bacterium P01_C01_bin.120]
MSDRNSCRMLLSHNFTVSTGVVPALSAKEFANVFQAGLKAQDSLQCSPINHPHWRVEIRFPSAQFLPSEVGELCGQALAANRRSQQPAQPIPTILVLGGLKTTPATSSTPGTLQSGEWGVDVVETTSAAAFLQSINWEATIAQRPADSVFQIAIQDA